MDLRILAVSELLTLSLGFFTAPVKHRREVGVEVGWESGRFLAGRLRV